MNSLFRLMTELSSRKWLSHLVGTFAKSRFSRILIPRFARMYQIPVEHAEKPLHQYSSLNDFFTRKLKEGCRPVDDSPKGVVSPVDAVITDLGTVQSGQILNIKGQDYTIQELLNGSPRTINYIMGFYFILYLSPTDYHRIHSPIDGVVIERDEILGRAYPVNAFGLRHMRKVLSRNGRKISYMRHNFGELAVVKVGAMNVSSIRLADGTRDELHRGDEMAHFEFGSTVILLLEQDTFECSGKLHPGSQVRMGEYLGNLRSPKKEPGSRVESKEEQPKR